MTTLRARQLAAIAFLIGLAAILGALASQYIGGLEPCELCYEQRLPYYWGLPLLGVALLLWPRAPQPVRTLALALVAAIFAYGTWLGGYHAGVEWGWWPGPTSCTGVGEAISFDALGDLNSARVVPCDQVQFRFLGLSLAGYNVLASAAVTILVAAAAIIDWRR
ncbi:disulfide bond formation protein DsbB [Devosia pacifica]|uniref:Disulfide bond formation protein DsbB n=1 Tax=Devosia pacifica TaxID=1335967 RepID=A0A918S8G3_9HYPH|nr:disulfide bond formation protein B [Devosia pacifica]GHA26137.1 disulfide bond formation protein DsbB [Devosia pacifica]